MESQTKTRITLAQSLIEQGLITNPKFIEAARMQSSLIEKGTFRLLGSIMVELQNEKAKNEG